jgi:hypothetical protein
MLLILLLVRSTANTGHILVLIGEPGKYWHMFSHFSPWGNCILLYGTYFPMINKNTGILTKEITLKMCILFY